MPFSTICGLDQSIRALQNALVHDQVAGTYLFTGPSGVGKTALALAFAQAAACTNPDSDPFDACGACDSCRRVLAGTQPEIHVISPAGDQTQIWQFWDRDNRPPGILQHTLTYAPVIGRRRVYIIERADTLNEAAANSLLKVLEEPPPYALFVLLSPHAARMLETVLSRCQLVRLAPAPVTEVAGYLEKELGLEPERARTIAAYAEGRAGTALRLARNPAFHEEMVRLVELAEWIADGSSIRALKAGESIRKFASGMKALADTTDDSGAMTSGPSSEEGEAAPKERVGRRQLGIALDMLSTVYRDLAALSLGGASAPIVHAERRGSLAKVAESRPAEWWVGGIETLLLSRRRVDQNASIPLLTDWLALRLTTGVR